MADINYRDLERQVAQELGETVEQRGQKGFEDWYILVEDYHIKPLPYYTADINLAWELVEYIQSLPNKFTTVIWRNPPTALNLCHCEIVGYPNIDINIGAETAPLAIVLAFLELKEILKKTGQ